MKNLNDMSDIDLICGLKQDKEPSECLMELVDRHSGIYMTMVNNYTPSNMNDGPSYKSELISDKNYYIYQAALKYDESRNTKFSTYLGNETRWMCLNLYNREKNKSMKEISDSKIEVNSISSKDDTSNHVSRKEIMSKILSMVESDPDSRISKIFKIRYLDALGNKLTPWKTVSKSLNLSIQGCINVHNKTINKIKKELQKEL